MSIRAILTEAFVDSD